MKKKRIKRVRLSKGEKVLYTSGILCLVLSLSFKVFFGASVSNLSMSIEKTKSEIYTQQKTNESLMMQVNELNSYENVKTVVNDNGLAYNNQNILVIKD